jgi:hypothetical protein
MVVDATFNDISIISWRSVLLVEKTGVPGENHRPVASHWQTLSHNVVSSTPCHERGKITTTTVPLCYSMNCLNKYKFNFFLIYRTSSHTIIKEHPGIFKSSLSTSLYVILTLTKRVVTSCRLPMLPAKAQHIQDNCYPYIRRYTPWSHNPVQIHRNSVHILPYEISSVAIETNPNIRSSPAEKL